jgi:DNA-binding MarR family transcriptional regulator/GNAT superfamily N-acetyltransferase
MTDAGREAAIARVRQFSRFYTRRIGVLSDEWLGGVLTLPQGRLVYEIAQNDGATLGMLASQLGLDTGYVSRLVSTLERDGLLEKRASSTDGRQVQIRLTEAGRGAFETIDQRSRDEVGAMLEALPGATTAAVVLAMETIERALDDKPAPPKPFVIRGHRIGDMGWVVHRHGVLYHQEYGWDETFEAMVAKVAADFIDTFDAKRCCARIAERDGNIAGSAFVVPKSDTVAKLRLVYAEPWARGTGLGRVLVEDCMSFAKRAGYTRMTLWTNDVLIAARRIYQKLGFEMTASEAYRGFGKDLVGETWERDL